MSLRLCVLASGSSGNCTYVASATTALLIDAGLSAKETAVRLEKAGAALDQVRGVCVSHEHGDHVAGLKTMHTKHRIPLFANGGTVQKLRTSKEHAELPWKIFHTGEAFAVGDLVVEPFAVPHDAMEPVGFVVSHEETRVAVVTDMGMATSLIRERLRTCHAIVLEANHDEQLLMDSPRPWALKQRILGRQGHLSNQGAARLLAEVAGPGLERVFLAHLSEECNRQDLAWHACRDALLRAGQAHVNLSMTYPGHISEIWRRAAR